MPIPRPRFSLAARARPFRSQVWGMSSGFLSVTAGPGWLEVLPVLRGTVLVVGKPGRGKSRLVHFLAEQLSTRGQAVGLVSADMGQASVGVPACLGLGLGPAWDVPAASWFIGDTTPVGNLLQTVVGTARLAQRAREAGAAAVLIDACGLADGPLGRVLQYHTALAAAVNQVVAIQEAGELEPLLDLLDGPCPEVFRLAPVPQAHDRPALERRWYRESLFQAHLQGGRVLHFRPQQFIGFDWTAGPSGEGGRSPPGTVLGLLDRQGFCLGLGLLEAVTPEAVSVYTACPQPEAVSRLQAGKLRLSSNGEELR